MVHPASSRLARSRQTASSGQYCPINLHRRVYCHISQRCENSTHSKNSVRIVFSITIWSHTVRGSHIVAYTMCSPCSLPTRADCTSRCVSRNPHRTGSGRPTRGHIRLHARSSGSHQHVVAEMSRCMRRYMEGGYPTWEVVWRSNRDCRAEKRSGYWLCVICCFRPCGVACCSEDLGRDMEASERRKRNELQVRRSLLDAATGAFSKVAGVRTRFEIEMQLRHR